jgi:ketosteroid isomerase-like protein
LVDALNAEDVAGFLDAWAEDCEFFSVTGGQIDGTPYRGHDGLRRYWQERTDAWSKLRVDAERFLEGGADDDVVVAVCRLTGTGRGSGVTVEQQIGILSRFHDDKVCYARSYLDPQEALDVAGLSE